MRPAISARLDATAAVLTNSEALARLLLRAEAVGSSQIEGLVVGARRLLKAEVLRERQRDVTAEEVLGAVDAMTWVTESVQAGDKLEVEHLLEAHRRLMAHSPTPEFGGEVRYLQNWIGGRSPAEAYYVPPPAHLIPDLLADLMTFVRESRLPVLAKTAIAHAQFETIHPFADGNGRTGRALIHLILRAEGLVDANRAAGVAVARDPRHAVRRGTDRLPARRQADHAARPHRRRTMAADVRRRVQSRDRGGRPLRADRGRPQDRLARAGRAGPGGLGRRTADRHAPGRAGAHARGAAQLIDRSQQAANQALARLVEARILREVTDGRRNRVYEAPELIDAFTLLERRFASPAADTRIEPPSRPVPSRPEPTHRAH